MHLNPFTVSTGKQRSQIPQVHNGRYSYRRHTQHQEHVGERQCRQSIWKPRTRQQSEGAREGMKGRTQRFTDVRAFVSFPRVWLASKEAWLGAPTIGWQSLRRQRRQQHLHQHQQLRHQPQQSQQWGPINPFLNHQHMHDELDTDVTLIE